MNTEILPKVSIIIPSYNKEQFILETINSVKNQTYKNWEMIIIDDGSTDNSWKIIEELSVEDIRIKSYQRNRSPKGGSVCRNIGLSHSSGEFIFFLDADDLITGNCIENRVDFVKNNEKLDFAVFSTGTFYSKIGDSSSIWKPKKRKGHLDLFLQHNLPWNISSVLWKRNSLLKLDGFDESYQRLQDVELHTRALIQGFKYEVCKKTSIDFYYRIAFERSVNIHSEKELNQKFLNASTDYLQKINKKLSLKPSIYRQYGKYLKGTYFECFNRVLTASFRWAKVDKQEALIQMDSFVKMNDKFLAHKISKFFILKIYKELFINGFWRLKGFNKLSKFIFIHLP